MYDNINGGNDIQRKIKWEYTGDYIFKIGKRKPDAGGRADMRDYGGVKYVLGEVLELGQQSV